MKPLLVSLFFVSSIIATGQSKLDAFCHYSYYSGGSTFRDSLKYSYVGTEGAFNSFAPTFRFSGILLKYDMPNYFVHCSSSKKFSGFVGNTVAQLTTNYTLSNDLATTATYPNPNVRNVYTYDSNGNMLSDTYETYSSANGWTPIYKDDFAYDAMGNLLAQTTTSDLNSTPYISWADSSWYVAGTAQLSESIRYTYNFTANEPEPVGKSLITYNGVDVDYIDNYAYTANGTWNWTNRHFYSYTSNVVQEIMSHQVDMNVVNPAVSSEMSFTYTASGQSYETVVSDGQGQAVSKKVFTYSPNGFIQKEEEFAIDVAGSTTKTLSERYYFQSGVGVEEIESDAVQLFPNPVKEVLTIDSENPITHLSLYSLSGKLLIAQTGSQLDMSHLPSGVYILKGQTTKGEFSKKIVKE